jgi:low temperature requirement protein LtrA
MVVVSLNLFALSAANMALKGLESNLRLAVLNFIPALIGMQIVVVIMLLRVLYSGISVFYNCNMLVYHVVVSGAWVTMYLLSWHLTTPQLLLCILGIHIIDLNRIQCYLFIGSNISDRWLPESCPRDLVPVHVTLLAERFGLFVVLAIGPFVVLYSPLFCNSIH